MTKNLVITFSYHAPYPKTDEIRIGASSLHTAISRAVKTWKKQVGRARIKQFRMEVSVL